MGGGGDAALYVLPDVKRGDDVEQGQLLHMAGMVQRQPIGGPRAPVMPRDREAHMAQLAHERDDILAHLPLCIVGAGFA